MIDRFLNWLGWVPTHQYIEMRRKYVIAQMERAFFEEALRAYEPAHVPEDERWFIPLGLS